MSHGESDAQPGPGFSVIPVKTPDVSEEAISDIPTLTPEEFFFNLHLLKALKLHLYSPQCGRPWFDPWVGKFP